MLDSSCQLRTLLGRCPVHCMTHRLPWSRMGSTCRSCRFQAPRYLCLDYSRHLLGTYTLLGKPHSRFVQLRQVRACTFLLGIRSPQEINYCHSSCPFCKDDDQLTTSESGRQGQRLVACWGLHGVCQRRIYNHYRTGRFLEQHQSRSRQYQPVHRQRSSSLLGKIRNSQWSKDLRSTSATSHTRTASGRQRPQHYSRGLLDRSRLRSDLVHRSKSRHRKNHRILDL